MINCISTQPITGPPSPTIGGSPLFATQEDCDAARETTPLIPLDPEPPPPGTHASLRRPSCWQFITDELAKGPLPTTPVTFSPREQGLLQMIAQGMIVYWPPECHARRVRPVSRTTGLIEREVWEPGRVVVYSLFYSFGKDSARSAVHLDYPSEGVRERTADGERVLEAVGAGGRSYVDFTVQQPLASLTGWFTTLAACRKHVKDHAVWYR